MEFQSLKYIYQPSGKTNAYTLLLLHGTGGNETDLLSLAEHYGHEVNVFSLRGNVTESGMPRFFKRLGMGVFDEADLTFRTDEMVAFIKELSVKEGFNLEKLVALGYSNGANIAGATLVKYPDLLAGAILFRPMQPFKSMPLLALKEAKPVFATSGKFDPTVDPTATVIYMSALKKAGFDVEDHFLSTSHNLTKEDIQLSVDWFVKNFGE